MKIGRLTSKLKVRKRRRDNQAEKFKKTGDRGHAKVAKREARAMRYLKGLLRKERRARRQAPKVMFDDVTVDLIPAKAEAVAGYVGGSFTTWPQIVARFPHAHKLSIAVNTSEDARCLDVEPGDANPADAPAWLRRQQKRNPHSVPVIYASISAMPEVVAAMKRAGIKRDEYLLWSAHYTFHAHLCGPKTCGYATKCDATQWTDTALGRSLDESLLSPEFFTTDGTN